MAMKFSSFAEAEKYLYSTVPKTSAAAFGGGAAFERSKQLFERLDNIQDAVSPIHIAATSGKGTTAVIIESILLAHGKTCVTLTSPHVYSLTERTRINGQSISEQKFVEYMNQLDTLGLFDQDNPPSYFEANMALGFLVAATEKPDYVIVETGFGGTLDTSNTITRPDKISVLGQIGYDHTHILGDTLEKIANQKAGIILPNQTVVALKQTHEVNQVFQRAAESNRAQLTFVSSDDVSRKFPKLTDINPRLAGTHQYSNIALALKTVRLIAQRDGWKFDQKLIEDALRRVELPGRFELIEFAGKTIIFDGAHNKQKLTATLSSVRDVFPDQNLGIVFSSSKGDDIDSLVKIIQPAATQLVVTEYHTEALDMYKPAFDFTSYSDKYDLNYIAIHSEIADLIKSSAVDLWLISGTFYILDSMKKEIEKLFGAGKRT